VIAITRIGVCFVYVLSTLTTLKGDVMKKTMWTVAALLAVAAIPIYLASRKRAVVPVAGKANDILDWDKQPWE
jgi:hypothetical protein